jgi:octaprenyl-diphosphate synthase
MKGMVANKECANTYTVQNPQLIISNAKQLLESELVNFVYKISTVRLHPFLKYAVLSKGKRLRPILVLLSGKSVGGDYKKLVQLALSFELLHTATIVHDDIIDNDPLRRGIKALHKKWSIDEGILIGDALIALSVNLAADYGTKIMKVLSKVGLELCEGNYIDISLSLTDATEEDYFMKIKKKSASLFKAAAYCGAVVAQGKPFEVKALAKFGEHFGMAYQLHDDLNDLINCNQTSQDFKNGNVTLPFLYLFTHGDNTAKRLLMENFGRSVSVKVFEKLKDHMKEIGAFRYTRKKIEEYKSKAQLSLKDIKESTYKSSLIYLMNNLI